MVTIDTRYGMGPGEQVGPARAAALSLGIQRTGLRLGLPGVYISRRSPGSGPFAGVQNVTLSDDLGLFRARPWNPLANPLFTGYMYHGDTRRGTFNAHGPDEARGCHGLHTAEMRP